MSAEAGKDEYVNRLEIPNADASDAGMYYCFVTNLKGYKFKGAYISVIASKEIRKKALEKSFKASFSL